MSTWLEIRPIARALWIAALLALVASACIDASDEPEAAGTAALVEAQDAASESDAPTATPVESASASLGLIMPALGELEFAPIVQVTDQPYLQEIRLGLDCDIPGEPSNTIERETYVTHAYEGTQWSDHVVHGFHFETVAQAMSYFDELAEPMRSCDLRDDRARGGIDAVMERSSMEGPVRMIGIDSAPVAGAPPGLLGYPISIVQGGPFVFAVDDYPSPLDTVSEEFAHAELVDQLVSNLGLLLDGKLTPREPIDIPPDPRAELHALMENSYDNIESAFVSPFAVAGGDVGRADLPACFPIVRPRGTELFVAAAYLGLATISGSGSSSSARPDSLGIIMVDVGADGDAQAFMDQLMVWRTQCFSSDRDWSSADRGPITTANGNQIDVVTITGVRDDSDSLSTIFTMVDGTHAMEITAWHGVDDAELAEMLVQRRDFAIDAFMSRPGR